MLALVLRLLLGLGLGIRFTVRVRVGVGVRVSVRGRIRVRVRQPMVHVMDPDLLQPTSIAASFVAPTLTLRSDTRQSSQLALNYLYLIPSQLAPMHPMSPALQSMTRVKPPKKKHLPRNPASQASHHHMSMRTLNPALTLPRCRAMQSMICGPHPYSNPGPNYISFSQPA